MDANYKPYKRNDEEFKRSAVALLETTGRPMAEVAGDFGIPYKTLERWRGKYRAAAGKAAVVGEKSPPVAQAELKELRRRLTHTERERDILKKNIGHLLARGQRSRRFELIEQVAESIRLGHKRMPGVAPCHKGP